MTVLLPLFVLLTLLLAMYWLKLPPFFRDRPTASVPSSRQLVNEYDNDDETLVVCKDCFGDVEVKTYDALLALSCIEERVIGATRWYCPRCGKLVYWRSDTVELG